MFYTEALIDRMSEKRSDADFIAAQLANPETVLLPVWRGQNLIDESANSPQAGGLTIAEAGSLLDDGPDLVFLGKSDERAYFAVDVSRYDEQVEFLLMTKYEVALAASRARIARTRPSAR